MAQADFSRFSNLLRGGFGGGGAMIAPSPAAPTPANLAGAAPRGYNPAYGGIPQVPNPGASAINAIGTNLGNLSNLYRLAGGLDTASGAGAIQALGQEIPGVQGLIGTQTGNISELQSGQLPADVIAQIQQQAAEIGAGSGLGPMSPSTNASYLRALGLTSLGMKEKGAQELNALMGAVPRAPLFDPSSMLVTPGEEQQWGYLANMLQAAPVPQAAAEKELAELRRGSGFGGSGQAPYFNLAPMGPRMPGTDSLGFREPDMSGPSYPILPTLGAINPVGPNAPPGSMNLAPGLSYNSSGWQYDPTVGAYVNQMTGQVADSPGGTPWSGFSMSGMNTPATEYGPIQDPGFAGPMSDYDAEMFYGGYDDMEDFYGP